MNVGVGRLLSHGQNVARTGFASEVLAGLTAPQKQIPPKYFYDARGSSLFEEITRLPEYYPTRVELQILRDNAGAIAALVPAEAALVEFGSGSSAKTRVLLRELRNLAAYVPVDVSADFLHAEALRLRREFPALDVLPVAADFTTAFALPPAAKARPRVGFFPGSTIGNFEPERAVEFMSRAAHILGKGARMIIGVDLVKDRRLLHAAYNDAAGVTAAFNLNLLARINRELGADFDLAAFEHRAFYDAELSRIEMHLVSARAQAVQIQGRVIAFAAGETIHTESSYKYTVESFRALARTAGWQPERVWTDDERLFSVHALVFRS